MPKKRMSLVRKNTTKRKRKLVLLRGCTSINNPGGGSNLTKTNGRAKTTATKGEPRNNDGSMNDKYGHGN
jgi:hypothetical protein